METVFRVFLIYAFLLVALRVIGKREFGQLSPLELVTLLIIPEIVSQALVREDFSLTNAIIGSTTLLSCVFLTSLLQQRSKWFNEMVESPPAVLVEHGRMIDDVMNRERVPPDEIFAEMHKAGLEHLHQVRWAVLEGDGRIAIIPERPLGSEEASLAPRTESREMI